jgi:hypothetical protein
VARGNSSGKGRGKGNGRGKGRRRGKGRGKGNGRGKGRRGGKGKGRGKDIGRGRDKADGRARAGKDVMISYDMLELAVNQQAWVLEVCSQLCVPHSTKKQEFGQRASESMSLPSLPTLFLS